MTAPAIPAMFQALALFKAPRSARPGIDERLPDGMLHLLRMLAGEEQALLLGRSLTGESAESLREAAGFYVQQVMFGPGSNSYRVLGVDPDASDERIREHFRWLARWLHPDRNPDEWENVYVDRVNQAWQHLRTPERRERYDQSLRESVAPAEIVPRPPVAVVRHAPLADADSPALDLRWLPKAIFAGLGVSALATVAVFYLVSDPEPGPEPEQETPALTAVALAPPQTVAAARAQPDPGVDAGRSTITPTALATPTESTEASAPTAKAAMTVAKAPATGHRHTDVAIAVANVRSPPAGRQSDSLPFTRQTLPVRRTFPPAAPASPAGVETASPSAVAYNPADASPRPVAASPAIAKSIEPAASSARTSDAQIPAMGRASVEEIAANRVLGHFSQAYADGNLDSMRAMFTDDARSPLGGLNAILANYGRVFEGSSDRSLVVRDVSWFTRGGTLTVIASYEATVTNARNRRLRRTHGDLRLDLRREDEQWRIYRLLHDEQQG